MARARKERRDLRVWNRTPLDFRELSKPKHQKDDSTNEINSEVVRGVHSVAALLSQFIYCGK